MMLRCSICSTLLLLLIAMLAGLAQSCRVVVGNFADWQGILVVYGDKLPSWTLPEHSNMHLMHMFLSNLVDKCVTIWV